MQTGSRIRRISFVFGSALALVVALPGSALAEPPRALPAQADGLEQTFQPAFDYDTDGCYPTPAIGPDGTVAPGLKPSGTLNGQCRDASDLDNTNGYARYKCNNGWCAISAVPSSASRTALSPTISRRPSPPGWRSTPVPDVRREPAGSTTGGQAAEPE